MNREIGQPQMSLIAVGGKDPEGRQSGISSGPCLSPRFLFHSVLPLRALLLNVLSRCLPGENQAFLFWKKVEAVSALPGHLHISSSLCKQDFEKR